jgi:hypothetical protein
MVSSKTIIKVEFKTKVFKFIFAKVWSSVWGQYPMNLRSLHLGIPVHLDIYVCSLYHFGADSVRHSGALWDVGSWAPRLHGPCQMPWGPHALSLFLHASGRGRRPRLHRPRPCGTHGPRPRGPGRHCMDPGCVWSAWAKVPLCQDPPLTRLHGCGS